MANKTVQKIRRKSKAPLQKIKIKNYVPVFEKTLLKSYAWISEMHKDLNWMAADGVYHLLRAVLQTLRDQLTVGEAAHVAAQLPLLLRGSFYEGWNPSAINPKGLQKEEFLAVVLKKMGPIGEPGFDLEKSVYVALKVIVNHVSPGEIADVIASLKPSLKHLFEKIEQEKVH